MEYSIAEKTAAIGVIEGLFDHTRKFTGWEKDVATLFYLLGAAIEARVEKEVSLMKEYAAALKRHRRRSRLLRRFMREPVKPRILGRDGIRQEYIARLSRMFEMIEDGHDHRFATSVPWQAIKSKALVLVLRLEEMGQRTREPMRLH